LDCKELVYILTVADCQSITKAANQLYISQPSLSHFILKIEESLGVKLFDRSTNPISLTYAGEKYVDTARKMIRLNENLLREFRDISQGKKGRIKIGIPKERAAYMLPLILPEFRKLYPGIEVKVYEARSMLLIDSVIKGQTDFLIIPDAIDEKVIDTHFIYEEELVLICKEDLLIQSECQVNFHNQVDIASIRRLPLFVLNKGHAVRITVDKLFSKHKIIPNIAMELSSNLTACRLAAEGLGAALVPELTVRLAQNVNKNDIYTFSDNSISWKVVAAFRRDSYIGTVERDFFEIARKVLSEGK
jgi:DNA-binding transcriptional LysR family regulator